MSAVVGDLQVPVEIIYFATDDALEVVGQDATAARLCWSVEEETQEPFQAVTIDVSDTVTIELRRGDLELLLKQDLPLPIYLTKAQHEDGVDAEAA